ncbi:tetratricopeptide repeat protein [Notoacmeibacter sp. MSK16QG-6]|uniref:tetratricopeptide repeat protein n=1 Tax=Notoacmeibacter sp. MSK16QG-6 TaxID=2957982 RepID=UPI0020A0AA0B|nr:tetratricopeptide repeat protein [Notoacmeibacter sp. MSK16QG-6]MCP1200131.1 sel1 repeat family protein [Notoacmeibacter sp. MSK16QG-6]
MRRLLVGLLLIVAAQSIAHAETNQPGEVLDNADSETGSRLLPPTESQSDGAKLPTGQQKGDLKNEIDERRFGEKPEDVAFTAFQLGRFLTAIRLATPLAESGNPAAQTLLGEIYAGGLGVPTDHDKAAEWYARAAEAGVPAAQFQYALMLLDGEYVEKNEAFAERLLKQAAEGGNANAQFNYAQRLLGTNNAKNVSEAARWYQAAARKGVPDAQYAYANWLSGEIDGVTRDMAEAREWLAKASKGGMAAARVELATWLFSGKGGERDFDQGFRLLRQTARSGNVAAQSQLAKAYIYGYGTDPDTIEAASWYIVARRAGLRDPELDDLMDGLSGKQKQQALERANRR